MKISFIICSRDSNKAESVLENVRATIHFNQLDDKNVEYENIVINNSDGRYNIFQAYNIAVAKSTGEILCFMHEDIEFLSTGWGNRLYKFFSINPNIDACAVAGCSVIRKCPSMYSIAKYNSTNIEQGRYILYDPKIQDLANFDGLWFCIRRKCFDKIQFDDKTFNGFHFYDTDIAVQLLSTNSRIAFIPDISIRHLGSQQFDKHWVQDSYKFYHKWKNTLPLYTTPMPPSTEEMEKLEIKSIYSSLRLIVAHKLWELIPQWLRMSQDVLKCNAIKAVWKIIRNQKSKNKKCPASQL